MNCSVFPYKSDREETMIHRGLRDDRNETFIILPSKRGIQVLCHTNKSLTKGAYCVAYAD